MTTRAWFAAILAGWAGCSKDSAVAKDTDSATGADADADADANVDAEADADFVTAFVTDSIKSNPGYRVRCVRAGL